MPNPKVQCLLESMDSSLKSLCGQVGKAQTAVTQYGVWTARRKGSVVSYEYQFVYAGLTTTINLDFALAGAVKRMGQIWNDGTAKDLSIRLFTEAVNAYYENLNTLTANTDTSISDSPVTDQELFIPAGGRLQFVYTNYTVGKICKIVVVVDES